MSGSKKIRAPKASVDGPWSLPDRWRWDRLKNVVEVHDYLRRPVNLTERKLRLDRAGESLLYPYYGATGLVGKIDEYLADGEYVLLGEDGAPFLDPYENKAYLVSGKFWVNNHAHVLKAGSEFCNLWLLHWLNLFSYHDTVNGTTRLKLTQAAMNEMVVPVPPVGHDRVIVQHIAEMFSDLDDGEAALAQAQSHLGTWRKALLKAAVTGELTADWREANPPTETGDALLAHILNDHKRRWLADPSNKGKSYREPTPVEKFPKPSLPEGWIWASLAQLASPQGRSFQSGPFGSSLLHSEFKRMAGW